MSCTRVGAIVRCDDDDGYWGVGWNGNGRHLYVDRRRCHVVRHSSEHTCSCLQDFDWDSSQDVEMDVSIIPGARLVNQLLCLAGALHAASGVCKLSAHVHKRRRCLTLLMLCCAGAALLTPAVL